MLPDISVNGRVVFAPPRSTLSARTRLDAKVSIAIAAMSIVVLIFQPLFMMYLLVIKVCAEMLMIAFICFRIMIGSPILSGD